MGGSVQRWILVKQEVVAERVSVGHGCGWRKRGVCGPGCLGRCAREVMGTGESVQAACVGSLYIYVHVGRI